MAVTAVQAPGSRKVLRNVAETLSVTLYDEEELASPSSVEVTVRDANGDVVVPATAAAPLGDGWSTTLPAQADLMDLEASWVATFGVSTSTFVTTHSVVGGFYATPAEVRAMDALQDSTAYPTARLHEAIDYAETTIERYTGASFVRRYGRVIARGGANDALRLGLLFPHRLLAVRTNGVAEDVAGWALSDEGVLTRSSGVFALPLTGLVEPNVVVELEFGVSETPPTDIAWAARTIARQYLLDLVSRVPDRALSMVSEFGQINLAQAGGAGRPTSLPEVNAVLNRHRHLPPAVF